MVVLYKLNAIDPADPEVLILGGAGSISLKRLKARVVGRLHNVIETVSHDDSPLAWSNAAYRTETSILNDMKTIIAANEELEVLRAKGGPRSRGIKKP